MTARLAAFVPATINGELHTGWSRLGRAARDIWIVPDRGRAADGPEAAGAGVADRGTRNQQIASKPAAALETVKHVSHILGKLGAANRSHVLARVRALGPLR